MKIAVLDDDPTQLALIRQALLSDSWSEPPECIFLQSGTELLERAKQEPFDLMILDRKVPDMSGDVILSWLRQYGMSKYGVYTLVVMLTNLNSEDHELYSLNSGADDYIAKPFSPAILSARVKRLLSARQAQQMLYQPKIDSENQIGNFLTQDISNQAVHFKSSSIIKLHDYEFNLLERIVTLKSGEKRVLTDREFNLAFLLFNHLGTSLARQEIFRRIWPADKVNQRSLDTHIHRLRIKLNLKIENGFALRTVYGFGYRLDGLSEFK